MFNSYVYLLSKIGIPDWLSTLIWPVFPFVGVLFIGMFFGVVYLVLMERRVLALLTVRKGPNRVGYDGLLQCIADGIKIIFKEDIMSSQTNKILFTIAPCLAIMSALIVYAVLPFTEQLKASNLAVGLLFILAVSSVHTIALLLAGWASNNKYSLIGGLRSAAQAISYEIPLIIATIGVVVLSGSFNLEEIIVKQKGCVAFGENFFVWISSLLHAINLDSFFISLKTLLIPLFSWNLWYFNCFTGFVGCLVFFICSIAEVNRIPFDLPEAESELVSGFSTEYSGMKFAMFFMAEYVCLFAIATLTVVLFFGGYLPFFNDYVVNIGLNFLNLSIPAWIRQILIYFEQAAWITFKIWWFIFVLMWIRATLPRLRVDQMMSFCWKFLLPLSLINLLIVTVIKGLS